MFPSLRSHILFCCVSSKLNRSRTGYIVVLRVTLYPDVQSPKLALRALFCLRGLVRLIFQPFWAAIWHWRPPFHRRRDSKRQPGLTFQICAPSPRPPRAPTSRMSVGAGGCASLRHTRFRVACILEATLLIAPCNRLIRPTEGCRCLLVDGCLLILRSDPRRRLPRCVPA